jgi:chaperone modulatory protein CbpM
MQTEDMIVIDEFCASHQLEISFIHALKEYGLIEVIIVDQIQYIPNNDLSRLEQIVRLNRELDINLEGIDAVSNLLKRIENMQNEITALRNRLSFYEEENK